MLSVSSSKDLPDAVKTVLNKETGRLFGEHDPQSYNKNFLSKHNHSIPHRVAGEHFGLFHHEMSGNVFGKFLDGTLPQNISQALNKSCYLFTVRHNKIQMGTIVSSLCHFPAAKMMVYLDPSTEKMAAELATCLDESLHGKSIQVLNDYCPTVSSLKL